MNKILGSTRIIDLTVDEFKKLIEDTMQGREDHKEVNYVYGTAGIAKIFNCSITTAHRIRKSGVIDSAISQIGNKIVIDANRALEIANKKGTNAL